MDVDQPDPDAAAAAQREEAVRLEARRINDLKWVMNDPRGRRFLAWLLEKTGVNRSSFTGNSETFFREGARNVGLMLTSELTTHTFDAYMKLLKEYQSNE